MKFLDFIKKHCFLVVSLLIILIVLTTGIIVTKNLFFSNHGDAFGNRLDGIEEHRIEDSELEKIKNELENIEQVINVENNIVGKRATFIIKVKTDTDIETSKGYANKILDYLRDDSKEFYDIHVMIINENEENQNYPIMGAKHKTREGFNFVN